MKKKVFIVDDDLHILRIASDLLAADGFDVTTVSDPKEALRRIEAAIPDLVLTDIRMPGMDGYQLCKTLKAHSALKHIPVIMLSVQASEADVVVGLELGADDYIRKPLRKRELLARVRTVLRRSLAEPPREVIDLGPLKIDIDSHMASVDGVPMALAPKEFALLCFFAKGGGRALTRATISENVWGFEHLPSSRTIDFHVDQLRKKLGARADWITGLKGIGYRFEVTES